ncbi:hypothetical protein KKB55_21365 [Myxococcota bacterium]|nr:hypothetical protein [Myxococcota bacterium]MBU1900299.1 hypothetical protein [Myxococcota bacterium]
MAIMNTKKYIFPLFTLLCACGNQLSNEVKLETQSSSFSDPIQSLSQIPIWAKYKYGPDEISILNGIGKEMMKYDLDQIRKALVDAKESRYDESLNFSSNAYILMRILFDVPDTVSYDLDRRLRSSTAITRPKSYKGDLSLLPIGWPIEWDNNNNIVRVHHFLGAKYSTTVYSFVDEFDAMREHFPRRVWK